MLVTLSDVPCHADVVTNKNLLHNTVHARQYHLFKDKVPIRMALKVIDKSHKHNRLSLAKTASAQDNWAVWEADKIKVLWAYFMKLTKKGKVESQHDCVHVERSLC